MLSIECQRNYPTHLNDEMPLYPNNYAPTKRIIPKAKKANTYKKYSPFKYVNY